MELLGFSMPSLASSGLVFITCHCFALIVPRGYTPFVRGSSSHCLLGFVLGLSSPRGHCLLHGRALTHRYAPFLCGALARSSSRGHCAFHGSMLPRRYASFLCGMSRHFFTRMVPGPSSSRGNGLLHGCAFCFAMVAAARVMVHGWIYCSIILSHNGNGEDHMIMV